MNQEQTEQLIAELRHHGSNVLLKRETDAADLIESLTRRASSAEAERDEARERCRTLSEEVRDGAPSRHAILDTIRRAFKTDGHGDCAGYRMGRQSCTICRAMDDLRGIATNWKGGRVVLASPKGHT